MQLFFNSRDAAFKKPFGAVRVGRAVDFSFPLRYDGTVYGVSLIVWKYTGETVNVPLYKTDGGEAFDGKTEKPFASDGNAENVGETQSGTDFGVSDERTENFGEIFDGKTEKPFASDGNAENVGKAQSGTDLGTSDGNAENVGETQSVTDFVGGIQNYTTDLILSEEGIYFYSFEIYTGEGTFFVGRGAGGKAELNGGKWQLTVYDKYPETPHPLSGGVIYHIFADRFKKGKTDREIPTDGESLTACGEIKKIELDRKILTEREIGTESGIFQKREKDGENKGVCGIFQKRENDTEKEICGGLQPENTEFRKETSGFDEEFRRETSGFKAAFRKETSGFNEEFRRETSGFEAEFRREIAEFTAKRIINPPRVMKDWDDLPTVADPDGVFRANDFFGGNAEGIIEMLDYIADLGANIVYLSPIFEAASNHRYDTGDYFRIDPLFGDENVLKKLVKQAKTRGMILMMDGVFNHTGADSAYFNKHGRYDSLGAYQSEASPYYGFYDFIKFPDKYKAWWGIEVVPTLNKANPKVRKLVREVVYKWMSFGIEGLRLDVADELPKDYLFDIRRLVKTVCPDAYLLGEVWEDASVKVSYGVLRPYLLGSQLDSVMNYPFKEAVLSFVKYNDIEKLAETVLSILENYPKYAAALTMNIIGTHDTARAINAFLETDFSGLSKTEKRELLIRQKEYEKSIKNRRAAGVEKGFENSEINSRNLEKDISGQTAIGVEKGFENSEIQPAISPNELKQAVKKLKIAALIQFTLPGIPSVYYGDEVGLLGFEDPLNRAPYPYGRENTEILEFYRTLGKFRKKYKKDLSDALKEGNDGAGISFSADRELLIYKIANEKVEIVVNNSKKPMNFKIRDARFDFLTGKEFENGENIRIERLECLLLTTERR
jgi:glycosidase